MAAELVPRFYGNGGVKKDCVKDRLMVVTEIMKSVGRLFLGRSAGNVREQTLEVGLGETTFRDSCMEELNPNQLQMAKEGLEMQDLAMQIENLGMNIEELAKAIEGFKTEIAELQVLLKRGGVNRQKQNEEFQSTVVDEKPAKKSIEEAKFVEEVALDDEEFTEVMVSVKGAALVEQIGSSRPVNVAKIATNQPQEEEKVEEKQEETEAIEEERVENKTDAAFEVVGSENVSFVKEFGGLQAMGGFDHVSMELLEDPVFLTPTQHGDDSRVVCFVCGKHGHRARECRHRARGTFQRGPRVMEVNLFEKSEPLSHVGRDHRDYLDHQQWLQQRGQHVHGGTAMGLRRFEKMVEMMRKEFNDIGGIKLNELGGKLQQSLQGVLDSVRETLEQTTKGELRWDYDVEAKEMYCTYPRGDRRYWN
eukprot:CAMPEP_0115760480 /NCGR_PEP_ID=MMETSP0272-20121206/100016_1 /TAXON_ID=71861 /ORGANISM="Scrippsiella trochoidea, Strain CCMP3099" /LENGTH=419 /DNA_ID=CAMNT_0003206137 /DNA_START=71 /DNA_END=1332 /DNA_ORIENTATION=-